MNFRLSFVVCLKLFYLLQLCSGKTDPCEDLTWPNVKKVDKLVRKGCAITNFREYFWKRWRDEYRRKYAPTKDWKGGDFPVEIDQVVMLLRYQDNKFKWIPGRVVDIFTGADGIPKVLTILTAGKREIIAGVHNIAPVPHNKWANMPITHLERKKKKKKKKKNDDVWKK